MMAVGKILTAVLLLFQKRSLNKMPMSHVGFCYQLHRHRRLWFRQLSRTGAVISDWQCVTPCTARPSLGLDSVSGDD